MLDTSQVVEIPKAIRNTAKYFVMKNEILKFKIPVYLAIVLIRIRDIAIGIYWCREDAEYPPARAWTDDSPNIIKIMIPITGNPFDIC